MIQVPANAQVIVMHDSVSFRLGIDGTAAIARTILRREPMDGAFFVFRNKGGHMLRILYYDGGGFWLCTRRLSQGRYSSWPKNTGAAQSSLFLARELQVLVWGGDPSSCAFPDLWRQVA